MKVYLAIVIVVAILSYVATTIDITTAASSSETASSKTTSSTSTTTTTTTSSTTSSSSTTNNNNGKHQSFDSITYLSESEESTTRINFGTCHKTKFKHDRVWSNIQSNRPSIFLWTGNTFLFLLKFLPPFQ